jgi:hypothetical protein
VSSAGAPANVVVASAPGRLPLSGSGAGPRLSVALDRRALCRVETGATGVEIESKDALTRTAAGDVAELLSRAPASVVAHVLDLLEVTHGLRLVTEWKLPAGSGVDGDSALALATTAAVAQAIGRELAPDEIVRLARLAGRRGGRAEEHGHHAALWGGVVVTRGAGEGLAARALGVDPGRIEEALLLVDSGEAGDAGGQGSTTARRAAAEGAVTAEGTERLADALVAGRYDDVVGLIAEETESAPPSLPGARRVVAIVREAGGAARPLHAGRLVAVWAPPGARGTGRGEAVRSALTAAGLKPLPIRVDLRGLEID